MISVKKCNFVLSLEIGAFHQKETIEKLQETIETVAFCNKFDLQPCYFLVSLTFAK